MKALGGGWLEMGSGTSYLRNGVVVGCDRSEVACGTPLLWKRAGDVSEWMSVVGAFLAFNVGNRGTERIDRCIQYTVCW